MYNSFFVGRLLLSVQEHGLAALRIAAELLAHSSQL